MSLIQDFARRQMDVGDLASKEKGSGARLNGGKPPLQWIPAGVLAATIQPSNEAEGHIVQALRHLDEFERGDDYALSHVLHRVARAAGLTMKELLAEGAFVLDHGAEKYAPYNWAKGMKWSVCIGCIKRHLVGYPGMPGMLDDPRAVDPESGRLHAGHVCANVIFLLEYMTSFREGDDRPEELRLPA